MKKRLASKIGAAVLAASMMMSMAAPAMAATTYTAVAGTSTTFNKYLIMDSGDSVPNATFSFTVAPGSAIAPATKYVYNNTEYDTVAEAEAAGGVVGTTIEERQTMAVLAGLGTPTIADVTFAPGNTTYTIAGTDIDVQRTNVQRGGSAGDAVQFDSGEKYAKQQATVSFSGITFPEPGIYRYIISETADAGHAAAGITHDTDSDRVLDVYVTDDGTGTLVVSGYVMHTDVGTVAANANGGSSDVLSDGAALADKTDGFTNELNGSKDLKITKAVSGNQASRDKWFAVTATFATGTVADADTFVVSLADDSNADTNDGSADATSGTTVATKAAYQGQTNATSVTGEQLKAGTTFYLQGGQSVVIRGLPLNASYTVTEDAEDYVSTAVSGTGKANTGVIGTIAGDAKMAEAGFTNTRNGVIPTGVMMAVAPFAVATLIGGAGVATMSMKKRKKEEDE